jgi:hypothetical protein
VVGDYELMDDSNPDDVKYYASLETMEPAGKFMKVEEITISGDDGRPMHGKKYTFDNNGELKEINDFTNQKRFLISYDFEIDQSTRNLFTVPPTDENLVIFNELLNLLNKIDLNKLEIVGLLLKNNPISWILIDNTTQSILLDILNMIVGKLTSGSKIRDYLDLKETFKSEFTNKFREMFISFINDINEKKEPLIKDEEGLSIPFNIDIGLLIKRYSS